MNEMKNKTANFILLDYLLLGLTVLPILCGIILKVLFIPAPDGIEITGAYIYATVKMPVMDLIISEAQINSWLVMLSVLFLCLYLTHGIRANVKTRRQTAVEWLVEKAERLVTDNMGEYFNNFAPFIAAMLVLSAFSSLLSLFGLFAPTSDINVVAGWAILVFALITYYKSKCGPLHYIKSFGEPVPFLAPLNVISEVATPISMAFRHYGNILSGTVISVLIASALGGLSSLLLGWLPGILGQFPFLQIGLPAILSVYFDVFSGLLQAYIFAMLTMLYVSGAFPLDDYQKRKIKKQQLKQQKIQTYGGN